MPTSPLHTTLTQLSQVIWLFRKVLWTPPHRWRPVIWRFCLFNKSLFHIILVQTSSVIQKSIQNYTSSSLFFFFSSRVCCQRQSQIQSQSLMSLTGPGNCWAVCNYFINYVLNICVLKTKVIVNIKTVCSRCWIPKERREEMLLQ